MNPAAEAVFYDGISARPQPAQVLALDNQAVLVKYGLQLEQQRRYAYADMALIGALGAIQPIIELKDDARLEFQGPLPEWFNLGSKARSHSIWKLERTPSLILFSVLFVAAAAFAAVKWGLPAASYYAAHQLPAHAMNSWGDQAEDYIMDITGDTQLPPARREALQLKYRQLAAGAQPAKVVFRSGGSIGANALAIPNNTIIVTDELVQLAQNDDELLGVLAHEQGHLAQRHSLQQALSSLGISAMLLMITGDSSDLLTTLPVALIGAGYSRDFESEADLHALNTMQQHHIQTIHYANFLQRLADNAGEKVSRERSWQDFLSSHPATYERIEAVKRFHAQQASKPQR